ncbi:MAG: hypothetical protein K2O42_03160 [Oscillospiraceae bacterium]|nr:hypothetical protein [Oscillospiraceae bacterium]
MRDYKTVAQRVLQRRDAYVLAQKRKKQMMIKYAAVPACLFLVIGAGFRIWQQTETGRRILEQNAVEMTETVAVISTENAGNPGNTENTENSEKPGNSENVNSTDFVVYEPAMTEPIQTDAESEPGHEIISETMQTGRVITETEVIVSDAPGIQGTRLEQNGVSPTAPANSTDSTDSTNFTETIPESTVPTDNNTATMPSDSSTDPPEFDPPAPTETVPDEPSVPDATEPTKPGESNHIPIPTEPEPTETDNPPAEPFPSTTAPPPPSDWVASTETDSAGSSYEPPMTTVTTPAKIPTNYTITVEEFTPTREQLENVTHETISMNFAEHYDSFQQLFENAGAAVRCKVLSVTYTIMQNAPYTVYHIEIIDSIYGSFIAGDKLSIVQYGGYLVPEDSSNNEPDHEPKPPSSSSQEELIEQQIAGSEMPVVSQEYVLFLTPDDVFDGAYEALHENEGMFWYDPETGELIRSVEQDAAINTSSYRQLLAAGANFIK